ncbi:MAG: hypothetical protein PHE06_03080 [Lachnospiraceae bacterium]|nr:hypothetical protein [Lachnospiraceae bacterium]MDD3794952.1 hypothetical protein [Lachnospiraceae bacterium]
MNMKKSIFAVCDLEASYACNLTEYMNERRSTPFEVQAFTNLESLKKFAAENPIEILLISTNAMCDEIKALDIQRTIILSEGEPLDNLEEELAVYKYQSSDQIIAEVMNFYARSQPEVQPISIELTKTELIGVYSPAYQAEKTLFALTLGEILGERKQVLYLNLEDYSGFETIFSREYRSDVSDLIYFARQKEGNLIYKLNGMIQTFHNLDYIPPAFSPADLKSVRYEEWMLLLEEIAAYGEYEVIILDLGSLVDELFQLMAQCGRIYVPILEDDISRARQLQFEKNLKAMECQEVLDKMRKLHLPIWQSGGRNADLLERMIWGDMGKYVRNMLEAAMN